MGQIVFNGQKPKYANLLAIKTGTEANAILDENEIWLIDSANAIKINGKGEYDKYIKGDGQTAAKNLPLLDIVPTHLSQLTPDTDHRTVSDEQISRWNEAAAGEGGTLIESSEDIAVVNDAQQNINRLELADKQYNALNHGGLGKVYLKKNIQTAYTFNTEVIFDSIVADRARAAAHGNVWQKTHDATYKSLAEATDNTDAKTAANTAYNTAYNNAINNGKTVEEATALGNAAYVTAYKNAVSGIEGKDTAIESAANTAANNAFEAASAEAIAEIYPQVVQTKKYYIDGRIQGSGNNRYIDITPKTKSPASVSHFKINATAGSKYRVFATKSDSAGGIQWLSRFWMVTETPNAGDTTAALIKAYKEDNQHFENDIIQEAAIIEVEQDCTIWVNYIFYSEHMEPCKIERIYETENTVEINTIPALTGPNTEYIIRYDYDLAGGMLEVPENSVLKFDGGSITNGYIKGNNSSISAFPSDTILPSVTLTGNWKNTDYYVKWFGAAGDGITDDTNALQSMLDIAEGTNSKVRLIWSDYTYKTTSSLFIKSNTSIIGGTIIAEFNNPLDWIMQTRSFYGSGNIETSIPPGYSYLASWQEYDGKRDSLNHIVGSYIEGLSLIGTLCKHMVIPEGGDETSEKVWDGTYCPIYGGLKINGGSVPTQNVTIRQVGIGIARGACLHSYDNHLSVHAHFLAYAGHAINTTIVSNSYLNAWCNYFNSSKTSSYTPYYLEYQGFNAQPTGNAMRPYIEGNGGIDDSDESKPKPKLCSVKLVFAGLIFNNTVTDSGAEVGFAATQSTIIINYPYFEGVSGCYVYARLTRVTIDMPEITSGVGAEYDLIGSEAAFVLSNCENRIDCRGGISGETHKYSLDSSCVVNVLNKKGNQYPDDDKFVFLSSGSGNTITITSASGTTLTADLNKYYKYSSAVNTLAVTLPAMESAMSIRGVCLSFTTGATPDITFTAADNKPIAYFDSYPTNWDMNSEYEINCMYNGTKWIIAAALIG